MSRKVSVQIYVKPSTRERWREHAEEMGMAESEFVRSMVEAGLKEFTREVEPDKTRDELRQQRNEAYSELREAREKINRLEEKLMSSARGVVIDYIEDNPGCTYHDIVDRLTETAPSRATKVLEAIEGSEVAVDEEGRWFTQ